ncbi:MAG: uncharacterized protein QOF76_3792, partial [Solirubrobacteraceae bacterium]|nr:uncharacterized protein [Solirubrobacteraceae bacterium]
AAQALTGVVLGAYLQSSSLRAVADAWLPVALVSAGTLGVCVGCGYAMSRVTDLDQPTAQLGLIAGGASGIVAMTDELGGDDRIVAFMQYLRVLIVVLITPVLAGIFFPGHHADAGAVPDIPFLGDVKDWAIVALCAPAGALAARAIRLPAGTLLGPMAVAGALTLTGAFGDFVVPELVQQTAFIFIGLQVGLKFTTATVKEVGKLLIPVLISIVVLLAACFVLALILTATTDQSLFSSYLATTPGGLYAVLAVAFGAGANTTFILAVQSLRLLVMVLLAPLVVRRVVSPRSG